MGHERACGSVTVSAPVCGGIHISVERRGVFISRVHFALKGLKLSKSDVAGATLCRRFFACGWVSGRKRFGTLRRQRRGQNIGGRVKVALGVTAHQLFVLRKSHVTLDDTRTHTRCGEIRLFGVFGKLHTRPAMSNGKIRLLKLPHFALLEGGF